MELIAVELYRTPGKCQCRFQRAPRRGTGRERIDKFRGHLGPMSIPKRAFADAAQQEEFRNLAAEMLPRPAPGVPG